MKAGVEDSQSGWGNAHGTKALGGRDEDQPHSLGQGEEGFLRPGEALGNNSGLPQDPAL